MDFFWYHFSSVSICVLLFFSCPFVFLKILICVTRREFEILKINKSVCFVCNASYMCGKSILFTTYEQFMVEMLIQKSYLQLFICWCSIIMYSIQCRKAVQISLTLGRFLLCVKSRGNVRLFCLQDDSLTY